MSSLMFRDILASFKEIQIFPDLEIKFLAIIDKDFDFQEIDYPTDSLNFHVSRDKVFVENIKEISHAQVLYKDLEKREHRERLKGKDKPSCINYFFFQNKKIKNKSYCIHGAYHREQDEPSQKGIYFIGGGSFFFYEVYYKNGKQHRSGDKPAYLTFSFEREIKRIRTEIYYKEGKYHRLNGKPAFAMFSFSKNRYEYSYFEDGIEY